MDRFGKAHFPDEWTGEEISARGITFGEPQPPMGLEPGPLLSGKMLINWDGKTEFMDSDAAMARWEDEKESLFREWKAEPAAWGRWDKAFSEFRQFLYSGEIKHRLKSDDSGELLQLEKNMWGTRASYDVLETGRSAILTPRGTVKGVVVVFVESLERAIGVMPVVDVQATDAGSSPGQGEGGSGPVDDAEPTAAMLMRTETEQAYLAHVEKEKRDSNRYPTLKDDKEWRMANSVTRVRIRELRSVHSPNKIGGAPKKN